MLKSGFVILPLLLVGCADSVVPLSLNEESTPPTTIIEEVSTRPPQANLLLNHTPAIVQGWLGQPTLVRRDADVQSVQFKNTICVLDVYFYRESTEADFLAKHVDVRTRDGNSMLEESCLKEFFVGGEYPEELLD